MIDADYRKFNGHKRFSRQFQMLKGLIVGIKADGEITDSEIQELCNWCVSNEEFQRYQPFRDLIPMIRDACDDGVITESEIADIIWVIDTFERDDIIGDLQTQAMQRMHGIIYGMLSDGQLSEYEIYALSNWIDDNDFLAGTYPYDEINSLITSVLSDKIITEEERKTLIATIADFVDTDNSMTLNREEFEKLKKECCVSGICSVNPDISFGNNTFCFTGESSKADRKTIAEIVEQHGGNYHDAVTRETSYLVVGNNSNPCWLYACYGRKVEQAQKLRKKGSQIIIVNEIDFWDVIQ